MVTDVAPAFIEASRKHLTGEYLPKIQKCLETLAEEDIWWRPGPASNSAGNLVLHLCGNARQWIVHGVGGAPDLRERSEEFAIEGGIGSAQLAHHLETTLADVDAVLAAVERDVTGRPDVLLGRRVIQGLDVSVLEAIYHVVEHFSQHAGQIFYITKMRTGGDLAFWEVSDGVARPNW